MHHQWRLTMWNHQQTHRMVPRKTAVSGHHHGMEPHSGEKWNAEQSTEPEPSHNLDDELFTGGRMRRKLTRNQKCAQRRM